MRGARRPALSRAVDLLLGATLMYATLLGTGLQSPWTSRGVNPNSGEVPLAARHGDVGRAGASGRQPGSSSIKDRPDLALPDGSAGDVVDHLRDLQGPIDVLRHQQQAEPAQLLPTADSTTVLPIEFRWNYTTATVVAACVRSSHTRAAG